ncbi:MAG: 3-dehydroquinate synthase [Spirochaetes bacterium]|nr:3-dehydroquinate synthase [Spirochaetota bacterium]
MAEVMHRLQATAGPASYDVVIGETLLPDTLDGQELSKYESIAVIASKRVYDLHREYLDSSLERLGGRRRLLLMEDSEENKSYSLAGRFLEEFIGKGLNRRSSVIGIGGGVVGDFAGYCAGLYMRGIPVVHVPTTLLAMVDSSIGGKSAVNLSVGKNIAGVFRQPALVVSDVRFLETLPDEELRNGLVEALKHGLIGDGETLVILEENDIASIRKKDRIADLIARSVSFKASVVGRDEREAGPRAILNFGHTIGHAIESFMEYRGVSHGEAVAAGISVKLEVCRRMGLLSAEEARRAARIIEAYGLTMKRRPFDIEGIIGHMAYDKKNFGGSVNFVLLEGTGNPKINQRIPVEMLREVMAEVLC